MAGRRQGRGDAAGGRGHGQAHADAKGDQPGGQHQYRLLAERSAVGWQTYRDGAAVDPDIAADWQRISEMRRQAFRVMLAQVPPQRCAPG